MTGEDAGRQSMQGTPCLRGWISVKEHTVCAKYELKVPQSKCGMPPKVVDNIFETFIRILNISSKNDEYFCKKFK